MWRLILVSCAFVALVQAKNLGYHDLVEDDWEPMTEADLILQSERLYKANCNCSISRPNKSFISKPLTEEEKRERDKLPREFDWREKMGSKCKSISYINDQSTCSSCWAFATTEVMSDRLCIHSNGTIHVQLSAIYMVACEQKLGCDVGVFPDKAFEYYQTNGIVSGGDYNTGKGCWPYPFRRGRELGISSLKNGFEVPPCPKTCPNPRYPESIKNDLHFGQKPYQLKNEVEIMTDIMKNGPVSADFDVYNDFEWHTAEVYSYDGKSGGGDSAHAIKILGWGETKDGVKYWLCANSWGRGWHNGGFFKIKRGVNECGIEQYVWASMPDLNRKPKA